MDFVIDQLRIFNDKLQKATRYKEVLDVSHKIFHLQVNPVQKMTHDDEFMSLSGSIIDILLKHFLSTKIFENHKKMIKAIFKLSAMSQRDLYSKFFNKYSSDYCVVGAMCLWIHAWLSNHLFCDEFPYDKNFLYDTFVQCSLKFSVDTKYFPLAIENFTQAYDIKLLDDSYSESFAVTVMCSNLEDNHQSIYKLLLDLYQRMITAAENLNDAFVEVPLGQLSWYNRNKYYLIAKLAAFRLDKLTSHKKFSASKIVSGMRIGLSHYHLYSASLMLAKIIHNKEPFRYEMLQMSCDILIYGTHEEAKNLLRLWFTVYDEPFRNDLMKKLKINFDFDATPSTSKDFYRVLMMRNAFKKELSSNLEVTIKNFYSSIDDVEMKTEIFEILVHDASSNSKDVFENILRLLKFLHFNISIEDSNFRDLIIRRLPNFVNFMATNRFRKVEIAREIFGIIRKDLYEHGMEYGTYESTLFSLNLLSVILKQFCGVERGQRLSRKTDEKSNFAFNEILKVNKIWNVTSQEIFEHLIKLASDKENKDIFALANDLIVQYFVKTLIVDDFRMASGENFHDWINLKVFESFNLNDVEIYHENISFSIMKFEYLLAKESPQYLDDLLIYVEGLKIRFHELKSSQDPVAAMMSGKNLFVIIDCINYGISRLDRKVAKEKCSTIVNILMTLTSQLFLDYINDGKSSPSFDKLDEDLREFLERSTYKDEERNLKHSLLLSIFFTLRSCAEISVTLTEIMRDSTDPGDEQFLAIVLACVEVNMNIMTRSAHKGIIEAGAFALGKITKIISSEFTQQCDRNTQSARNLQYLLIKLKNEIDCNRIKSSLTGEIRGTRGLMIMAHHIVKNHHPFLKFLMDRLLVTVKIKSFYDTKEIKFIDDVQPIHLHLLANLLKDAELVGDMRKFYDFILLATFRKYKETTEDFIMQNALLQIIGSLSPKISNQKRHALDDSELPDYEYKSIGAYDFYVKMTYSFRIALYDLENFRDTLPNTYIIILLEICSNFEHRRPIEFWSEVHRFTGVFVKLLSHRCEKIRILAAKCFAQWHLPENLPEIIEKTLFRIFYKDQNLAHASVIALRHLIQRYEASVKFVEKFDKEKFLADLRKKIVEKSNETISTFPQSFYLRCYFIDFLGFIGFKINDEIMQKFLDESTIKFNVGYLMWREKVRKYYT